MNKRVLALSLIILLCLPLFSIPAAAAPAVTASYSNGVVSVSGTGFTSGADYMVRVIDSGTSSVTAMTQVSASVGGTISASIAAGALGAIANYCVYVNELDGTLAASDTSIDAAAVETYALTVQAGAGGAITAGTSGNYAAGTAVTVAAAANSGYVFSKWESNNGGTFIDPSSASTTVRNHSRQPLRRRSERLYILRLQ